MTYIQERLFELRDIKYRDFNSALIPNVDKENVIGVRTPELKRLAKELKKSGETETFLASLPHRYFEENQLHGFIIAEEKDFDICIEQVKVFLPYVDNWATCDQLSPKCFAKQPEKLLPHIEKWLDSKHTYEIRFGVLCFMRYFLDDRFKKEYAEKIAEIKSDEYYVKMAIAWYFATALAKQYNTALTIISENRLDAHTHNKTIQKAIESFRVSDEHKSELRLLKRR